MLRVRPDLNAVVHTHSVYAAAVSCLADIDADAPIPAPSPPTTACAWERCGCFPTSPRAILPRPTPWKRPARVTHALLLRNHGPVVAGADLDSAVDALEELEHTAQLFFVTRGLATAPLTPAQLHAFAAPSERSPS